MYSLIAFSLPKVLLPFSTALSEAIIKPGGLPSDLGLSPTATVVEHEKIKRTTENRSNLKITLFDIISHLFRDYKLTPLPKPNF